MKKWKLVGLALAVAAGLSACVPVAEGTSMSNPIVVDVDAPRTAIKVKPGSTWYVSSLYSARYFDVNPSELNRLLRKSSYSIGDKIRGGLSGFSLVSTNIPEGWKLGLVAANGYREITDMAGDTVTYIQGVELVFGVEIPKDARGTQIPVTARVSYNGKVESAGFLLQITQ